MDTTAEHITLSDWYTAGQAAQAMSKKAGREVKPAYLRSLVRLKKIATHKLDDHTTLYLKSDVDNYQVEARGKKAGAAMAARAKQK